MCCSGGTETCECMGDSPGEGTTGEGSARQGSAGEGSGGCSTILALPRADHVVLGQFLHRSEPYFPRMGLLNICERCPTDPSVLSLDMKRMVMDSPFLEKFQEREYQVSLVGLRTGQLHSETSSALPRFINLSLFLAVKQK